MLFMHSIRLGLTQHHQHHQPTQEKSGHCQNVKTQKRTPPSLVESCKHSPTSKTRLKRHVIQRRTAGGSTVHLINKMRPSSQVVKFSRWSVGGLQLGDYSVELSLLWNGCWSVRFLWKNKTTKPQPPTVPGNHRLVDA